MLKDPQQKDQVPHHYLHFCTPNPYDIWRCYHSQEKGYTFFSKPHSFYSHISLFISDKTLLRDTFESEIHTITWSDHAHVSIQLDKKIDNPAMSMWRNYPTLMSTAPNLDYLKDLNALSTIDPFLIWATHKAFICGILIKLSPQAKRQRTLQLDKSLTRIDNHNAENKKHPSPAISNQLLANFL